MRIACAGGGPAGLYFAISMKLRDPSVEVDVFERNQPGDTFGWGVVFSDQTMENLKRNDPLSAAAMEAELAHWDDIDVHIGDTTMTSTGHGFIGIGRKRLLNILQDRAVELGVRQHFEVEIDADLSQFADYDLIIASDGLNSKIRTDRAEKFKVDIDVRPNKFVWLGTHQKFDAFKFIFVPTEHGWIWAHAYKFDADTSTFIVECKPETFEAWGFGSMTQEETCRTCEKLFEPYLGGHPLMTNANHVRGSAWISFPRVLCHQWHDGNVILLGDAAHTAHYSIGSGTKLAFEDAILLAEVLANADMPLEEGLRHYQEVRNLEVLKLQSAAKNSMGWFEEVDRYLDALEPWQFMYALLTRSQRVSHESLRKRDPAWLARLESDFASKAFGEAGHAPVPPMFTPLTLRGMTLSNRVVMSPMATYSAADGLPGEFHLVHYGARAMGGAGLIYTEMTCVSPSGRITPGCTGIWSDQHTAAWKRIVDFVHGNSAARFCMQIGHSGAKGSTRLAWDGIDEPLAEGNWPLIAASTVPYGPQNQTPRAMTRADMDEVRDQFAAAARRADEAGFDMIELHAAHGYLIASFITPTQNTRSDEYGGSLANRLRFPLEVFAAMRASWPASKPMSVRISAHDWVGEAGVTPDEAVEIARAFCDAGADLIDVSSGQSTRAERPVYGRMFQTPFADQIRNELGVPTMTVGNIYEVDHVNSILAAGRADLCALARPHLIDPHWTLRAAAELGHEGVDPPRQYRGGFAQLGRNMARASQMFTMSV